MVSANTSATRALNGLWQRSIRVLEVQAWVSARAAYLMALRDALLATGLDCSSFIDGKGMSLARRIRLEGGRLVTVPEDQHREGGARYFRSARF